MVGGGFSVLFDEDRLFGAGLRGFPNKLDLVGWDLFGDR